MKKYSENKQPVTFTFPIEYSDEMYEFVLRNSRYAADLWNIFRRKFKSKSLYEINERDGGDIDEYYKEVFHGFEKGGEYYVKNNLCRGASRNVADRFKSAIKSMKTAHKNGKKLGKIHFKEIDPYRFSFQVENKMEPIGEPAFSSKFTILDFEKSDKENYPLNGYRVIMKTFREKGKSHSNFITFNVKERIYTSIERRSDKRHIYYNKNLKCKFSANDIKKVIFLYELGKLYLMLVVTANFEKYDNNQVTKYALGIDYGIQYPAMMYDGEFKEYSNMIPNKVKKRLDYLITKTEKIQTAMNKMFEKNGMKYSNNYMKLWTRFRKIHAHISGITKYWNHKISKELCKTYVSICVDPFEISDSSYTEGLNPVFKHNMNKRARKYSLFMFNQYIKYKSLKYGTIYFDAKQLKKETTNKCCVCGKKNKVKLQLSERVFTCSNEDCTNSMNRDMNAAVNCYNIATKKLSKVI